MAWTLNTADVIQAFRKRFGIRDESDTYLLEVVSPTVNLGDLDGPPWNWKKGILGGSGGAAVAAQLAYVLAFNANIAPGGVDIIRRIYLSSGVANNIRIGVVSQAEYATLGSPAMTGPTGSWDSVDDQLTTSQNQFTSLLLGNTTSATAILTQTNSIQVPVPAGQLVTVDGPFALRRNAVLCIQSTTVNVAITAALYGDEYTPE